jgi:hypothetical protein
VDFIEGGMEVIWHKIAQFIHLYMLVFIGAEQMVGKLPATRTLISFQDHGAPPTGKPSVCKSKSRISCAGQERRLNKPCFLSFVFQ